MTHYQRGAESVDAHGAGEGPAGSYLVIGLVVLSDKLLCETEEGLVEIYE